MRILLIEDDEHLAQLLVAILKKHNYLVDVATDGENGWEMIRIISYDLVLLDVNLPKLDGINLCRRLRDQNQHIPVLLMTVRNSMTDKLTGLESGADDYLVKPFDLQELLARIQVLSRRCSELSITPLTCGSIRLNPQTREITYQGQVLPFSRKEYLLIELFLRHPHRVFSRSEIVDHLWSFDNLPTEDTVKSHIRRIRRKLSEIGAEEFIETLYGHGYRINPVFLENSRPNPALPSAQMQALKESIEQVWQTVRSGVLEQVAILEQAITLLQAGLLDRNRLELARQHAHKLAGAVGSCGFEVASHIASAIELLLQQQPIPMASIHSLSQLVQTLRLELEQPPRYGIESAVDSDSADRHERPYSAQPPRVLVIDNDPAMLAERVSRLGRRN